MNTSNQETTTYTVTAWDIYNLASHKAEQSKKDDYIEAAYWDKTAAIIKKLTTEFHTMRKG